MLARLYFKVRIRQGRKLLEKGAAKETMKKTPPVALVRRSHLALFYSSVPNVSLMNCQTANMTIIIKSIMIAILALGPMSTIG